MANILSSLFNFDRKRVKEVEVIAQKVDAYKEQMAGLDDDDLKEKTNEFKERLNKGETLDDLLPEAFAVVREAAKRVIGEFPYFVQIMGGIVLHQGDIAEMKTGEGKTLTSVMPVYLNALTGKGVHIVTVNEYLAQRDAKWMGAIHRFLGLKVGVNIRALTPQQKRESFLCDITYMTNAEVGFDYLRDNMVTHVKDRVLRPLHFALIDEVDSILIDESRTPLIISGGQKQTANLYLQADKFVKRLTESVDYEIDVKGKTVQLTEEGVTKAEKAFGIQNLYELKHTQLVHHLHMALRANYVMIRDVEYVVQENQIVIVDQFTGRLMVGRAYSDGLHQAIEAKERVPIKQETSTMATITYQNFFRLYEKLAGMTGTAKTEEEEFLKIYNMRVVEIPTNRPVVRDDLPDAVFGTRKAKFEALVQEVLELYKKGQPVLVGTIAVETSEFVSKMFTQRGIKHEVLNAKNHAREAEIIAKAGQKHSVTIATNMAGRGTDIKLGEGVKDLGGLAVIGSERHESRRIDNQLRGRSGRQGDPGYSRFYVSVQDELMVRFGSERMEGLFRTLGDVPVESKLISRSISSAQKRVEGVNFDVRKTLLEYDDVLRQQREIIYEQRNLILENEDVHTIIKDMFDRVSLNILRTHTDHSSKHPKVNVEELLEAYDKFGFKDLNLKKPDFEDKDMVEIEKMCTEAIWLTYEDKIDAIDVKNVPTEKVRESIYSIEKNVVLRVIDRAWVEHIDTMSKLRDGIHLRSYAQSNPLQAYIQEGFEMYEDMMQRISQETVFYCKNMQIQVEEQKK
ncbi:MAG: preprotein translocase subunit SecA [Firmicutes bacterium HGW-Firmicutes-19]|nr:MAG: preprotein translocase subunit SecA [Firmicutes bacterium HGW-Firmicutes-19]